MYVLPYGQMSLWGATVITNLMSAIPWVGQDIVELKEITNIYSNSIFLSCLPIIGTVHKNNFKNGKFNSILENQEYINTPWSFLAFFAGLVDGDGDIKITKTNKGFITMKLVISLPLEDISTLFYIFTILKVGKLNVYNKSSICKLVINKRDLQEIVFPLFLYNNIFFLTKSRINQFNLAMHILKNDIIIFDEITSIKNESYFELPIKPSGYLSLFFFRNWIIGFTMSGGSFIINRNNDGCFKLKQIVHSNLYEALKIVFISNRNIEVKKPYNKFTISSKSDLQKVIDFFSFSGLHPLFGSKGIQYIKWLISLRESNRYNNLIFPESVL